MQARHHEPASQIDHLGALGGDGFDIGHRTHGDELAILDRYCLGPGLSLVHRVDPTVGVDRFGEFALRLLRAGRDDEKRDERGSDLGCLHGVLRSIVKDGNCPTES